MYQGWPTGPASEAALQEATVCKNSVLNALKVIRAKCCSVLTDERLTELARTALSTYQNYI
jgi:hypothetical protein